MCTTSSDDSKDKGEGDPPSLQGDGKQPSQQQQQSPNHHNDNLKTGYGAAALFHHMTLHPWAYMLFWPTVFALLIGFGWTRDDIIEDEVEQIWIPQSGAYASDLAYANSLDRPGFGASTLAAMAIARDKGNLFTAERLEEIRARMEETERVFITHKGVDFYWEDFCVSNGGDPYALPCARLSPMDFFQEANWFMNFTNGEDAYNNETVPAPRQDLYRRTWYKDVIRDKLIKPRMPRFGVLTSLCAGPDHCADLLSYRMTPNSSGHNPLALFADIGNIEMNDPCRICIEENYTATIQGLTDAVGPAFSGIAVGLQDYMQKTGDVSFMEKAQQAAFLAKTITTNDVDDFYFYYVTRSVYAELGAPQYVEKYAIVGEVVQTCEQGAALNLNLTCPKSAFVNETQAREALLNHADAPFSSVTTAGAPFPLWSEGDGTGYLFEGDSPVGGSGIDMSAPLDSLARYIFSTVLYNTTVDPASETWTSQVEKNPLYAWFIEGMTVAEENVACGNGYLTGTNLPVDQFPLFAELLTEVNTNSSVLAASFSQSWCTLHNIPNTNNPGQGPYTKQHFARMWYDLLIDSDAILGIQQGKDDPYTWTMGQGCGYVLGGERNKFTDATEESILVNASRPLYYLDEGALLGVIPTELLMGDVTPALQDVSFEKPLKHVGVIQTLYGALSPHEIVQRVRHCKRPVGGPVEIAEEDAEEILYRWKLAMENTWTRGWDSDAESEVQFVAFFDDAYVVGTAGRALREVTLDNNKLTIIAIVCIALFSALFLFSFDSVESRVVVTLVGVSLVVMAYFAGLGFAILIGNKISVAIAWTLPFIILGLGVDDMYIVLLAVRSQEGHEEHHFLSAMKEVVVPVTMTSVVNAAMFAILNLSDIPGIYVTAQVAVYCIILLYCAIVFCYPAFVYMDMKRQAARRRDILGCKRVGPPKDPKNKDFREIWLYDNFYEPLVLGRRNVRVVSHLVIWSIAAALFATGCYGFSQQEVGAGLEDFFPSSSQAGIWATTRTESLASWPIIMNWGQINYTDPSTQMKMIKQFEQVVATPHVLEVDTRRLWLADFLLWTTRYCAENFDRADFDALECGQDKVFLNGGSCSATWKRNTYGLRNQAFVDIITQTPNPVCNPVKGGICRSGDRMHLEDLEGIGEVDPGRPSTYKSDSFCPTVEGWSDDQWQFCLLQWRNITGNSEGRFVLEEDIGSPTDCEGSYNSDQNFSWPIPISSGPFMFTYDLFTHQDTLDMILQTRKVCDNDEELRCFIFGIGQDYWSQYDQIFTTFLKLAGLATAAGFAIAWIFLLGNLMFEGRCGMGKILCGSLIGALFIALTMVLSLVTVAGVSMLVGVNLTGFSNMAFVLSVGFAVEYSVHVMARFLKADLQLKTGLERVKYTMSFLMLPTFMSFFSSLIGVICLAFTEFEFNFTFFFQPLIILMFVTYFYGCWWLPAVLTLVNWDIIKFGHHAEMEGSGRFSDKDSVVENAEAADAEVSHAVEDSLGLEDLAEA